MTRMRRLGVLLCAVLMFTAATGSALAEDGHGDDHDGDHHHHKGPPPANVAQAKLCLHNGWKAYVRADLTPFKNVAACVVYALKGGVLTTPPPPRSAAQVTCETIGGTFGKLPNADFTSVTWSCANILATGERGAAIAAACTLPDTPRDLFDPSSGTFTEWCGQHV